ncbi:MAG: exonuclease domain-containing protein [Syntrophotaleaceae bacterium]
MGAELSNAGVVVLDFETSGISPERGDRAIEIGAVRLVDDRIVERFQSLMNPGLRINGFIEHLTGISNAMLQRRRPLTRLWSDLPGSSTELRWWPTMPPSTDAFSMPNWR